MSKNDSPTQVKQEQENKSKPNGNIDTNGDGNFDKKLDGPNRPAE